MIKIATCDDEQLILDKINMLVKKELENFKIEYNVTTFISGEKLLSYKNVNDLDIIFLDIELKSTNGVDVAKQLREYGYDKLIVFITSFADYSTLGYRVNAFRYILKDKLEQELSECIRNSVVNLGIKRIKLNDFEINIKDIIYVESNKHQVIIHLQNTQDYKVYDTLDNIEKKLNSKSLLRVHKSYLVNILYVSDIKPYTLLLVNEKNIEIPIPKARYSEVKKKISIKKTLWR